MIFSEVRTRGPGLANDEMIELYNPGTVDVTLTSAWVVEWRSETVVSYGERFTGSGQVIPPGRHFLIVGSMWSSLVFGDAQMSSGISDEGSLVLRHNAIVVDAVCFNCGTSSFTTHTCEGSIIPKVNCAANVDTSFERRPGGALGNCLDTQDNAFDFVAITPSLPQNLTSLPTP